MIQRIPRPQWYMAPARALFVAFLLTLVSFALTLFTAIVVVVIGALLRHTSPNLPYAYRHVAFPVAVGVGLIVFLISLVVEVRHLRQSKALAGIARASR